MSYFPRPRINHFLWKLEVADEEIAERDNLQKKVTQIAASGHFSYAIVEDKNDVYSWGLGENSVLGNRSDNNQHQPYLLDKRMFENNRVL